MALLKRKWVKRMSIQEIVESKEACSIEKTKISSRKLKKLERISKTNEYRKELNKRRVEATEIRKAKRLAQRKHLRDEKKDRRQNIFYIFTTPYFLVGISLILISVVLSAIWVPKVYSAETVQDILCKALSTIGIAIMLGAIFDFSKGTDSFMRIVSNILSDIVISKNFLTTLSDKDKESALEMIIKPPDKQIERYSNINDLYTKTIHDVMNLYDINFKTNVTLSVIACKDPEKNIVCCDSVLTQTIYKIGPKFKPIENILEKENTELTCYVLTPKGEGKTIKGECIPVNNDGIKYTTIRFEIPEEYQCYDHLMLKRTIKEPGHKNWINFYWYSVTPCEGLVCTIDCKDDLIIKDHMIFDNKAFYEVSMKNSNHLEITSAQWLNTDTGFVVTIGDAKKT